MHQQREQKFNIVLQEIIKFTYQFDQISEIRITSQEIFATHIFSLNLTQIEVEYSYPFSIWLIDKFQENPPELIKVFSFLQWLKHPFQPNIMGYEPIIHHICNKPNSLLMLKLLFLNIEPQHYQSEFHPPPYARPMISDEVFNLLIDNHFKFSSNVHPIFWAIKHQNDELLERILQYKPKWINVQNEEGFTPLMMAIQIKNESSLLKLLKFNPNPRIKNHQQATIAHILYQTQAIDWINKLSEQPEFCALSIESMIKTTDINHQIPLGLAISVTMIPWIRNQLENNPQLRTPLYKSYTHAILQNRFLDIEILYHQLRLQFLDQNEILTDLLLKAKETHRYDILSWFLNLDETHPEVRKAMHFFTELEKFSVPKAKTFIDSTSIDWDFVPAKISFAITSHLIKLNQSQMIAELKLFHLHAHFHTFICPQTKDKTTILDIALKNINLQLHPKFITYFLRYLDQNAEIYPSWLADFHSNFFPLINKWSINKNKLINGSPLIHYISHQDEINHTQLLSRFINSEVQVNRFDKNGKHLFANLLETNPKGFEQIKELYKNFHQFSLENLDLRGSNLLHLSIESRHIPCISWCLSQNLSHLDIRFFDQKNAIELAFDYQHLETITLLKKNLKKSQLLPFLSQLITQKRDDIIQDLLSNPQPFDWKFSEPQIKALKTLNHSIIDAHLDEFYLKPTNKNAKKTPLETTTMSDKPKTVQLTIEMLIEWIKNGNAKAFEKLGLPEYQPILEIIFENHFIAILESVFKSPHKPLNKTFIRIPAAIPKFEEHQAWLHLLTLSVTTDNTQIFDNLIGRQFIFDNLKINIMLFMEMNLHQMNNKWLNLLITHFPLSEAEQQLLLHRILDKMNIPALAELLKCETYQKHLIALPIDWLHRLYSQDSAIIKIFLQFKLLEQHIFQAIPNLLSFEHQQLYLEHLIKTQNLSSLTTILKHESYQHLLLNMPLQGIDKLISSEPSAFHLLLTVNGLRQHIIQNVSNILSPKHQKFLLQNILETLDIQALEEVLKIESYQYHLIESPIDLLQHLMNHDKNILKLLLQFKPIEKHIIQYASKSLLAEQQRLLLHHLAKGMDIPSLAEQLNNEFYQDNLIQAPLEVVEYFLNQGVPMIELLLQYKKIKKHVIDNAHKIMINGLKNQQKESMSFLLRLPSFRNKFHENQKEFLEEVINLNQINTLRDLWLPYYDLCFLLKPYYPTLKMKLPKFIKNAFKMGYSANQALFIFGSTIHFLIENMSFEFLNDIDFISSQPPPRDIYQQSHIQPQLFFTSVPLTPHRYIKFDYFCIPHSINHFIAEDYQQRDFTVNCLYCDKDGHIFDPTNLGLSDLGHRMIRSVKPSSQSFAQDPIRLLRAIKLMLKGFHLFPEVEKAMHDWNPNIENMNFGHIYAMASHMLTSANGHITIEILIRFNLVTKLLQFEAKPTYENVLAFVTAESSRYKNISPKTSPHSSTGVKK